MAMLPSAVNNYIVTAHNENSDADNKEVLDNRSILTPVEINIASPLEFDRDLEDQPLAQTQAEPQNAQTNIPGSVSDNSELKNQDDHIQQFIQILNRLNKKALTSINAINEIQILMNNGFDLNKAARREFIVKNYSQIITDPTNGQTKKIYKFDSPNPTSLMIACHFGAMEIASFLLKKKADPNYRDGHGNTAIFIAVQGRHVSIVKLLIQNHALYNIRNNNNFSPIAFSVLADDILTNKYNYNDKCNRELIGKVNAVIKIFTDEIFTVCISKYILDINQDALKNYPNCEYESINLIIDAKQFFVCLKSIFIGFDLAEKDINASMNMRLSMGISDTSLARQYASKLLFLRQVPENSFHKHSFSHQIISQGVDTFLFERIFTPSIDDFKLYNKIIMALHSFLNKDIILLLLEYFTSTSITPEHSELVKKAQKIQFEAVWAKAKKDFERIARKGSSQEQKAKKEKLAQKPSNNNSEGASAPQATVVPATKELLFTQSSRKSSDAGNGKSDKDKRCIVC